MLKGWVSATIYREELLYGRKHTQYSEDLICLHAVNFALQIKCSTSVADKSVAEFTHLFCFWHRLLLQILQVVTFICFSLQKLLRLKYHTCFGKDDMTADRSTTNFFWWSDLFVWKDRQEEFKVQTKPVHPSIAKIIYDREQNSQNLIRIYIYSILWLKIGYSRFLKL